MSYTRRSIIRDAAILSLSGATTGSPLSLLAEAFQPPAPSCGPILPRPAAFQPGIRIFFCGAWLFCPNLADTTGATMLALTHDLPGSTPYHNFPFGLWHPTDGIDSNPELLPIAHQGGNYQITGLKASSPAPSVNSLFSSALCFNPVTYLRNTDNDLTISTDSSKFPKLRAISLPLPTQIIPGALFTNGALSGDGGKDTTGKPRLQPGPAKPRVPGIPSAYIFDYQGASTLQLANGYGDILDSLTGQDTTTMNYHFHTVPIVDGDNPLHGQLMFANLLKLISSKTNSFNPPNDLQFPPAGTPPNSPIFNVGPDTPSSVKPAELEMPSSTPASTIHAPHRVYPKSMDIASCASGGAGVGGGGG